MLHKLPDNVSFEDAVLVESMAVALSMVRKSRFHIGDNVVVIGAGMVGLSGIQFLKAAGARNIVAIEPLPAKRDLALQFGADLVLDPVKEGDTIPQKVMPLCDGLGADIVYECAGAPGTLPLGVSLVKSGGQFMLVGVSRDPFLVKELVWREIEMKASLAYTDEFGLCIDLIAQGKVNTNSLISDIISLDDIVEKGFERLAMPNDLVRVIVAP
jgi:(R,R)-butanediol dehydrogenase/meso-butanediol dehydrogenase/diacetyl reductase